jgi:hypothetical protein
MFDIISVQALDNYQLLLKFEDGLEGIVNINSMIEFTGVFEPLRDYDYFRKVKVKVDSGTIEWENKADLDPAVLYSIIINQKIRGRQILPQLHD